MKVYSDSKQSKVVFVVLLCCFAVYFNDDPLKKYENGFKIGI